MVVKGELHLKSWDRRGARKGTLLIYETRIVWDGLHLVRFPNSLGLHKRVGEPDYMTPGVHGMNFYHKEIAVHSERF